MAYHLYRNTTLGDTLQESLHEMLLVGILDKWCNVQRKGDITPHLASKVLSQFDKCVNSALDKKVRSKLTFKSGKLNTYRFCDNVWTFLLEDVNFREIQELGTVKVIKVVACDGQRKVGEGSKDS